MRRGGQRGGVETMALDFMVANGSHIWHLRDDGLDLVHVLVPHILIAEFGGTSNVKERVIGLGQRRMRWTRQRQRKRAVSLT
jgi:hypothetical protein